MFLLKGLDWMKGLPEFKTRGYKYVLNYMSRILTNERQAQTSSLQRIITFPDGHYRAIFTPDFFTLPEGQTEPTKSQWNTLKKRMKRIDKAVFIFKEHGETPCDTPQAGPCYYVDFGFMAFEAP